MIVIPFPDKFEDLAQIPLPGLVEMAGWEETGTAVYRWTYKRGIIGIEVDADGRKIRLSDQADPQMLAILRNHLDRFGESPSWHGPARRLLAVARDAVGVGVDELTPAQMRAVLGVLLWDLKALDADLRLKPLIHWLKRHPPDE